MIITKMYLPKIELEHTRNKIQRVKGEIKKLTNMPGDFNMLLQKLIRRLDQNWSRH